MFESYVHFLLYFCVFCVENSHRERISSCMSCEIILNCLSNLGLCNFPNKFKLRMTTNTLSHKKLCNPCPILFHFSTYFLVKIYSHFVDNFVPMNTINISFLHVTWNLFASLSNCGFRSIIWVQPHITLKLNHTANLQIHGEKEITTASRSLGCLFIWYAQ